MKEYFKRPSIVAGIAGLILAVLAFLPGLIPLFKGRPITEPFELLGIAVGLILLWVTHVAIIVLQQIEIADDMKRMQQDAMKASAAASERFMDVLRIDKEFTNDVWLHSTLALIAKLLREANKVVFNRTEMEDALNRFLEGLNSKLQLSGFRHEFPKAQEIYRMIRLKRTVEDAQKYVYAVTFDGGSYLEDFWTGEFSDEYVTANSDKTKRQPGIIRRAFVIDKATVMDTSGSKHRILREIIAKHRGSNIRIHMIFKDNVPGTWKGHDTSFLLCDDFVVSESYSLSDEGSRPGYVAVNDEAALHRLKKLFFDLTTLSNNEINEISKALGL